MRRLETVRAIGPACESVPKGLAGHSGTRPYVGLIVTVPLNAAGIRNEPPPSVPTDHAPMPSATAAALPPLDPPAVSAGSHGLPVAPCRDESVTPFQPNSGVVVFPSRMAPVSRSRATAGASSAHGPRSSMSVLPRSVGHPRVGRRSLIEVGTPSPGPAGLPDRHRASDRVDAAMAASGSTRTKALTASLPASIAANAARAASTGDTLPSAYASTSSEAVRYAKSVIAQPGSVIAEPAHAGVVLAIDD